MKEQPLAVKYGFVLAKLREIERITQSNGGSPTSRNRNVNKVILDVDVQELLREEFK